MENKEPSSTMKSTKNIQKDCSHISISDFLSFLKTAYQVQDSVEGILMAGGMTEAVNWLKLKETEFSNKHKNSSVQTAEVVPQKNVSLEEKKENILPKRRSSTCNPNTPGASSTTEAELKNKLNEVLAEGLLDSVLPYLVHSGNSVKKSTAMISLKATEKVSHSSSSSSEKTIGRRTSDCYKQSAVNKTESEVEIHVCDEVKNMKKTFVCNQKLLVEKMGYFAEVTLGQKLEDMDISVHCDISIFEWLMQWVRKDKLPEEEWPKLDPQCVIPVLVSAAFLQMEPLLNDCLLFCHEHMNEILRTSTNLSCLNDSVLTRLAAMYTNTEVESIKDRKDKIQSRLFSKLIQSLGEADPESVRGHWCSLAKIFRCEKCQQLIDTTVASKIPCLPSCMRLQPDGSIVSLHVRDPAWNLNDYIVKLHKSLKTWRKVYWRLWGEAHFLYCTICKRYFPVNQIGWCRYHPDTPQFFTLDAQKAPLPLGRYPCCGERAYRFQLLENHSGCQFRLHLVCTDDVRHAAIFSMLESYRHLIEEEPPQLLFPERLTRLVARDPNANDKKFVCKETFWWDGFEIIPPRPKMGLLTAFANRTFAAEENQPSISDESTEEFSEEDSSSSTSSRSETSSVESNPTPHKTVSSRKPKKHTDNKLWQHNLSARSNQDIQRAYEENLIKEMTLMINKKCLINENSRGGRSARPSIPLGGIWVRLESEWRDSLNQNVQNKGNKTPVGGAKYSNKPRGKF